MNREQRRKYAKHLKSEGYSEKQIEYIIKTRQLKEMAVEIPEGTQVKINVKRIRSYPDYNKNIDYNKQRYHEFLDANEDKVFTVKRIDKYKNIVELHEDESDKDYFKWQFSTIDLIVQKEEVSA